MTNWIPTPQSSNIASISYEGSTLSVAFKDGDIYHYENVPRQLFEQMQKSPSVGSFLHKNIKGKFKHSKTAKT